MLVALQIAAFALAPAVAQWGCRRSRALDALSPVVLCYIFGITLGNTLPLDGSVSQRAAGVGVLFAIGLLLVAVDFRAWVSLAPVTLRGSLLALASVCVVSALASLLFAGVLKDTWQLAGMLVGVYTGGTVNMAAIARGLDVPAETYLTVHTSDVVLGGVWFLLLLSFGARLFGALLRVERPSEAADAEVDPGEARRRLTGRQAAVALGVGTAIVGIGVGSSLLVPEGASEATAILAVTSLAVLLSFNRRMRRLPGLYEVGDYLLLVFCVAVGSLASLERLTETNPRIFVYTAVVLFGSMALHLVTCRIFRVDRDSAIITSTAAIYGPAFIAPVAVRLRNPQMVVSGITAGLVGLAVGNYLGMGMAWVTRLLLG